MAIKKVKLPNNTVVDINDARIPGIDNTPTAGSSNVVTSGGVATALGDKYEKPATGIPATDIAAGVIPSAPGTLNTTATTAQTTSSSEALSGSVTLHKVSKTGSYNDLNNRPTIPSAPGTLITNATTAQTASSGEAMTGNITLHKVSKTGTYSDLVDKPAVDSTPTQSSPNLITSGGVKAALDQKISIEDVDVQPSSEPGGQNVTTITLSDEREIKIVTLNGLQGNTGSSIDYPYELVNNRTTNDATKGLSAAEGKRLGDDIAVLSQDVSDISDTIGQITHTENVTSEYTLVSGKQAYGNVGSTISIGNLNGYGYYRIDASSIQSGSRLTVSFNSGSAQVSSHVQFVDSSNVIKRRLYVSATRATQFTFDLEFEDGEVAVYVSGALNKFEIDEISASSLPETITDNLIRLNRETSSLIELSSIQGDYKLLIEKKGKQSYGSIGSLISEETNSGIEYVKISGTPTHVKLRTHPSAIVSSYVQYVDESGYIISRDLTSYTKNTEYNYTVSYPTGATAVYINGTLGSIVLSGEKTETVKDRVERIDEDVTVGLVSSTTYSLADAKTNFQDSTYDDKLISASGATGAAVNTTLGSGCFALKIPLTGVESVTYPLFKTSSKYGSVAITSGEVVVWEKANTTEDDGTLFKVYTSELSDAAYLLVGYADSLTAGVTISNYSGAEMSIRDYVTMEMPSDNYLGTSEKKVLNLKGASELYYELLERVGFANSGGMDAFNDFGVMPSCVYGDANAFLADGTINSSTARIMYSDVIAKYDALVTKYPNYITKTAAGYDASGTIQMYYYTFTPKYWEQSVYLQAGVHGWEPDPVFALAEIMYLIANAFGTDDLAEPYVPGNIPLKYLRGKVKFTIFPVVNPWGFNNRGDCGIDKRSVAQNNYNGVQLNANWGGNEAEAVMVRTLVASLANELSFAIDMHSTVWSDSRTRYGCFYGGVNSGADNLRTIYRTYEWLYQFYNVKYPSIVDGDQVPNELGGGYASIGYMSNTFNSYFYSNYNIQTSTMEFSDHVWTQDLHTSVAMSVAVNMYLNHIIQQVNDKYNHNSETGIPSGDMFPARG